MAPVIAAYAPTFIVSSDLSRAAETARLVAAPLGLEVRLDPRLREFSVGDAREGRTWAEFCAAEPEQAAAVRAGDFGAVAGAEAPEQATARFLPALAEAAQAVQAGETGMVVAHGAVMRTAALEFVGARSAGLALGGFDNCGFAVLDDSGSGFMGMPDGQAWRIRAWNRVATGL